MKEWYVGTIKNDARDKCGLDLERNRGKKVVMYCDDFDSAGHRMFRGRYPLTNIGITWNWWEDMFSEIHELS